MYQFLCYAEADKELLEKSFSAKFFTLKGPSFGVLLINGEEIKLNEAGVICYEDVEITSIKSKQTCYIEYSYN